MVRKSVIEELEYHRRDDKSTNLAQFDNFSGLTHIRSCHPELFYKKGVLRNFAKIHRTLAQVFSCEFCEISKNTFLHRTPLVAASDISVGSPNIKNNSTIKDNSI